jgi:DNA-binding NtrC family response regulator
MVSGTGIRPFARLLDKSNASVWAISPTGKLIYLSSGCSQWLGFDSAVLLDRRCVAGAPISDDKLDLIAAALAAPAELQRRGTASLRITPPSLELHRPEAREVRFIRVGEEDTALTFAIAGDFNDRLPEPELKDAVAIRQQLDSWRRNHASTAINITAGISNEAVRLRRRINVAASTRTDIGLFGPPGSGGESILMRIHELSAPAENLINVDGPLMDSDLLDATLMPALHQLAESKEAGVTALVRGLDEMPFEAQQRLAGLLDTFAGRLRLLACCGSQLLELNAPTDDVISESLSLDQERARGLCSQLIDVISSLTIVSRPLAQRVDDIPLIATAMLDTRHAAGEGPAERINRAALDALVVYPWPHNYEELEHAIGHAIRTAPGNVIACEHLPLAIRSYQPGANLNRAKQTKISLDDAIQRYELRLITEALEMTGGNRAEAARRLGISRARLIRRLEDGLPNPPSGKKSPHRESR